MELLEKTKELIFKVKHTVKRRYQVAVIETKKKATKDDRILRSDYEKEAISICCKLISKPETILLLSPDTSLIIGPNVWKRYILNEEHQMYIIIKDKSIDIINHTYHYNISVCNKTLSRISLVFDGNIEKRRKIMETEIFNNVKNSLRNINRNLL